MYTSILSQTHLLIMCLGYPSSQALSLGKNDEIQSVVLLSSQTDHRQEINKKKISSLLVNRGRQLSSYLKKGSTAYVKIL